MPGKYGDLSPLAGLVPCAGEKLGVAKGVLYGVPEMGTEKCSGLFLCEITPSLDIDES